MEESNVKKPFYKKWWIWVIAGVSFFVILGIIGLALIKTGNLDAGVNVHLEGNKSKLVYEPSFYYQNNEFKVSYELDDFKSSCEKTNTSDGYVYYDVTIKYSLSCQLRLNDKKYNDDTIDFTPCIVFYSTNNSNFSKVVKEMKVNSGHQYDFTFTFSNVCGGKEKEVASFDYYVKLSVPANE